MFSALLRAQFASLWASLTRNTTGKKKKSDQNPDFGSFHNSSVP